MPCVKERVLKRLADVLSALAGDVVNDLSREEANVKASLVLALPVIVFRLSVDHNDRVSG